jgi:hypothetical protein
MFPARYERGFYISKDDILHSHSPCGGELEYLHRSPASRKGRQKGNAVSIETVKFGLKFCLDLDLTASTAR